MTVLAFTSLRVTTAGVVLYDRHLDRLARAGPKALAAFEAFARTAEPGVYRIRAHADGLDASARSGSFLRERMPARLERSPFAGQPGPWFEKLPPPNKYDAIRLTGISTLLTDAPGDELLESCVAALVGWDGQRYVLVPRDRPRVRSTAEEALRAALPFVEAPLAAHARTPLILLNAVKGPCRLDLEGREPFPEAPYLALTQLLARTARRP